MLKIKNIHKSYSDDLEILRGVDLEINTGEFILIMGPSGSGKSTLFNIIAGFEIVDNGTIENQSDLTISTIFQNYNLLQSFTVFQNLEFVLMLRKEIPIYKRKHEIEKVLAKVGMSAKINQNCSILSGGEQQRVAIARCILSNSEIILADEPTGNVDSENEHKIIEILTQLAQKGKSVLVISHNEIYKKYADKIYLLNEGRLDQIN